MRKILIFTLILFFIAVSIASAAETQIRFPKGQCYEDGTLNFSIMHLGRPLYVPDVNVSAIYDGTDEEIQIQGNWTMNGETVDFIGSGKAIESEEIFFISNSGYLTREGKYIVNMKFTKESGLGLYTNIMFAVECPGVKCDSDTQCGDSEKCMGGTCNYLDCGECGYVINHQCFDKCEDSNPCTFDTCDRGQCIHKKSSNCCSTDSQCNDDLTCTTDACVKNQCVNSPLVCKNSFDPCLQGTCEEPFGCMYATSEKCVNSTRRYSIVMGAPEVINKIHSWQQMLQGFKDFVDSIIRLF